MKLPALWLLCCACALAQVHHHGPDSGGTVDLAKLPHPVTIDGIGHSHITITTKSHDAQRWFDQGLALLHCFWDYEALRAFEEAVRLDPDCAMCHWGLARALTLHGGDREAAKAEIAKAKDLQDKASDHEQRYIRADAASADEKGDERDAAYAKEMEALIQRYPDDVEAKLFYVLSLNHGYDDKGDPRSGTSGQAMLRELLRQYPENAAANHYWIHAVEGSDHPEWALDSAAKSGTLAPASGHMVHMPGHIYFRTGDYERAREIFLAAKHADAGYMQRQHVSVRDDWNYVHNISYLIADCAEEGRYRDAHEEAHALSGAADDPDRSGNPFFYVLQIGSTEARLAVRYGRWDDVIEHPLNFGVSDDKLSVWARGYRDGLLEYARGMKAAEANQLAAAESHANALEALLWRVSQEELDEENQGGQKRVLRLLGTASLELRGLIAGQKGDPEGARKLLARADEEEKKAGYSEPPLYARPALEVFGAVLIRAGKFDDARAEFAKELARRPASGFALYGIAAAWDKEGKREEATQAYRKFLDAWSHADHDLPQVKAARLYLGTPDSAGSAGR